MSEATVEPERLQGPNIDLEHGRLDFDHFGGIVAAFEVSPQCIVVETTEGRHVRITARRDLSTGKYVSDYERLAQLSSGGSTYQVWAHTSAYPPSSAYLLQHCLAGALSEVSGRHLY